MELKSLLAVYLPLCAAPLAAARPASNAVFIVGGSPAEAGEFPFIVSTLRNGRHWCGGVLLNANTVLTAAHCVESQPAISQVRAGSLVSYVCFLLVSMGGLLFFCLPLPQLT